MGDVVPLFSPEPANHAAKSAPEGRRTLESAMVYVKCWLNGALRRLIVSGKCGRPSSPVVRVLLHAHSWSLR